MRHVEKRTKIIRNLPFQPKLKIMIFNNQPNKPIKKMSALFLSQPINRLDMVSNSENALPARNRISANTRADCSQLSPDILRGSSGDTLELEIVALCLLDKSGCANVAFSPSRNFWYGEEIQS